MVADLDCCRHLPGAHLVVQPEVLKLSDALAETLDWIRPVHGYLPLRRSSTTPVMMAENMMEDMNQIFMSSGIGLSPNARPRARQRYVMKRPMEIDPVSGMATPPVRQ